MQDCGIEINEDELIEMQMGGNTPQENEEIQENPAEQFGGEEIEDEDDPRAELVRRLQEYERFKQAATDIDELPRTGRENFATSVDVIREDKVKPEPQVELRDILMAFQKKG